MRSFLQSSEWEIFQKLVGRRTYRIADTLLIAHDLPFARRYLYAPRPAFVSHETAERFAREAGELGRSERALFLRIDPLINLKFGQPGAVPAPPIQPAETTTLDLRRSEEELLSGMHEKTRYNIRLAERKGVGVTPRGSDAIEDFWEMLRETAGREGFRTHEPRYYRALTEIRSEDFSNEFFFATYGGTMVAAALVNFYRPAGTATYLHGASTRLWREVMAPQLLHWRIMREVKRRNFHTYDLRGIDAKKWPGLTRFKLGFGGALIEYPPSVDLIYRPLWYALYRAARSLGRVAP